MAKVRGKEVAVGAITAGEIILHLTERLSDISPVNPGVHLEALRNQFGRRHNEVLVKNVASYIDSQLFHKELITPRSKRARTDRTYYQLYSCADVRLQEAALWSKKQGFNSVGRDELLTLGSSYLTMYVGSPSIYIVEEQGDGFNVAFRYEDPQFMQVNPAETILCLESNVLVVSHTNC